jgi:hypothetical protein
MMVATSRSGHPALVPNTPNAGHAGMIASVVSDNPREPEIYKRRLGGINGLSHVTIEVHRYPDHEVAN